MDVFDAAVREIHAISRSSRLKYCISLAGAGASVVAALTSVPGSSASLIAASVPYSCEAFDEAVAGRRIDSYASASAARALACAALASAKSATRLVAAPPRLIGFGVAGALSTVPPRKGGNAIYFAAIDDHSLVEISLLLLKTGQRSRHSEEAIARALTLAGVSHVVGAVDFHAQFARFRGVATAAADAQNVIVGEASPAADPGAHAAAIDMFDDEQPVLSVHSLGDPIVRLLQRIEHPDNNVEVRGDNRAGTSDDCDTTRAVAHADAATHVLFVPAAADAVVLVDIKTLARAASSSVTARDSSALHPLPFGSAFVMNAPLGKGTLIVPGSFNPLHSGHKRLALAAQKKLSDLALAGPAATLSYSFSTAEPLLRRTKSADLSPPPRIVFELSAANVDKPPLDRSTVVHRVAQFFVCVPTSADFTSVSDDVHAAGAPSPAGHCVVITSCARFVEKAELFPGCAFAIGYDTAARLIDPKYYGNDEAVMERALWRIAARGSVFVVAGRAAAAFSSPSLSSSLVSNTHTSGSSSSTGSSSGGGVSTATAVLSPLSTSTNSTAPSCTNAARAGMLAGPFLTLDDLIPRMPRSLRDSGLFVGLTEAEFRDDVSSTALRAAAAAAATTIVTPSS